MRLVQQLLAWISYHKHTCRMRRYVLYKIQPVSSLLGDSMNKMDELYAEAIRLPDFPKLPEGTRYGSPIHVAWTARVLDGWRERLRLWTDIRDAARADADVPEWARYAVMSRVRECEDSVARWGRQ
jgi:hypothetical protein